MRKTRVAVALTVALAIAIPAVAELCTIDAVPAATLLLPYFEVNLKKLDSTQQKESTLFSINNASAAPTIAHVVLWTDMSIPALAFDVFLTGYDVQTIYMDDLFRGDIPGFMSDGCVGQPDTTTLTDGELLDLRDSHIGNQVGGLCLSQRHTDQIARGYVTIDSVNNCSTLFPGDSGYFGSGGVATDDNVFWGEYTVFNTKRKYAETEQLVSVEAAAPFGTSTTDTTFGPGSYTFYGRYVDWDGSDNREPLVSPWGARYWNQGRSNTASQVVVWRDSGFEQQPFECNFSPGDFWYPLSQEKILMYDEEELVAEVFGVPVPFPAETQQVRVGSNLLPTPYSVGWLYLDLGVGGQPLQSHVTVRHAFVHKKARSRVAGIGGPLLSDNGDGIVFQGCPAAPDFSVSETR